MTVSLGTRVTFVGRTGEEIYGERRRHRNDRRHTVGMILVLLVAMELQAAEQPRLEHCWVYLSTNMLVDENVTKDLALLRRAADACYTAVVLTDSKFMWWDGLPDRYVQNVARVPPGVSRSGP